MWHDAFTVRRRRRKMRFDLGGGERGRGCVYEWGCIQGGVYIVTPWEWHLAI